MHKKILLLTALIPLLGIFATPPNVQLLLYSAFIFITYYGLVQWQSFASKGGFLKSGITTGLLVLFLTENIAWLNNYFEGFKNAGALFSTSYTENLFIGAGFYFGMTFAWLIVNHFFSFTTLQAFITYGVFGVFLEQKGAVLRSALDIGATHAGFALLIIVYVFLVHGSIMGLIHLRLLPKCIGKNKTFIKYPLAVFSIWVGATLGTALSVFLATYIF
jgi:hypothetical protein